MAGRAMASASPHCFVAPPFAAECSCTNNRSASFPAASASAFIGSAMRHRARLCHGFTEPLSSGFTAESGEIGRKQNVRKSSQKCQRSKQRESFVAVEGSRADQETDFGPPSYKFIKLGQTKEDDDLVYGLKDDLVMGKEDLQDTSILRAVVKVYCVSSEPDFSLPWQQQGQCASTGSGFMISGRRLLTNAHCVEHHAQVKVKKTGHDTKYIANVLAIGVECDIALLSVESEEFWMDVQPLEFGSLPYLQDAVTVVGYPVGGDTISVTRGVVSRIEMTSYVHGDSELLALQIDAAINPGNSGGPAFNDDGECVGIAFQTMSDLSVENIGYVIPTTVISHFLKDYKRNGKYTGFPSLGLTFQKLENPALRSSLKMKPTQKGILVRKVEPTSPSKDVIMKGDVILRFDKIPVANEATVPFRPGERIAFGFLVSQKFTGDQAELQILRDGKEMTIKTTLRPSVHLVPNHIEGRQPSYFIVAGLVFTPVTGPLIRSHYQSEDGPNFGMKWLVKARHAVAEFEGQELVLLSQVLANSINIGYEHIGYVQVLRFNGTKIRNARHLCQLVDSCQDQYMQFELDEDLLIVLETESAHASTAQILKDYYIFRDRSQDLMKPCIDISTNDGLG